MIMKTLCNNLLLLLCMLVFIDEHVLALKTSRNRSGHSALFRSKRRALPELRYDCTKMPNICNNIRNALADGKSRYLTRSNSGISSNRRAACGGVSAPSGMSCDEYPFASTRQGGIGARTAVVPMRENYSQGGQLSAFYRKNNVKTYGRNSHFYLAYP